MVYRPMLSDETREVLEDCKTVLKQAEEQDFPDRDTSDQFWRNNNATFDNDWIIREALKMFKNDWGRD